MICERLSRSLQKRSRLDRLTPAPTSSRRKATGQPASMCGPSKRARRVCGIIHTVRNCWATLGTSYALKGDLDAAEAAYRHSLTLAPSHYQTLNNLGGVAQQRGDLEEAITAYRRAIKLKADYVDAWSNLGLAHIRAKRSEEAVQAIEQAIALAPSEPSFYYDLGDAHSLRAGVDPHHAMKALDAYRTFLQRWQRNDDTAQNARNNVEKLARQLKASKP